MASSIALAWLGFPCSIHHTICYIQVIHNDDDDDDDDGDDDDDNNYVDWMGFPCSIHHALCYVKVIITIIYDRDDDDDDDDECDDDDEVDDYFVQSNGDVCNPDSYIGITIEPLRASDDAETIYNAMLFNY